MNTTKMTLADQKHLMNAYPNRAILPYFKLSTDMACWLLDNPSDFHDELMTKFNSGEIYYSDLISILECEAEDGSLFDISDMAKFINRKTGNYFTEALKPEANVTIRTITGKDIKDKYVDNWLTEINDNDEINGSFLYHNPQHNESLVHCPENDNQCYGCWIDDKLEGVIRVDASMKTKWLWSFFVNPANQGSRIGSILLNYVISVFVDSPLRLSVYTANKTAIKMYEKFGFLITGKYTDTDCYEMTRAVK
jgi:ribosomal protein S18 acetylase RimI-like enzyme